MPNRSAWAEMKPQAGAFTSSPGRNTGPPSHSPRSGRGSGASSCPSRPLRCHSPGRLHHERDRVCERPYRHAAQACGHFPNGTAALNRLYPATPALDRTSHSVQRWKTGSSCLTDSYSGIPDRDFGRPASPYRAVLEPLDARTHTRGVDGVVGGSPFVGYLGSCVASGVSVSGAFCGREDLS